MEYDKPGRLSCDGKRSDISSGITYVSALSGVGWPIITPNALSRVNVCMYLACLIHPQIWISVVDRTIYLHVCLLLRQLFASRC